MIAYGFVNSLQKKNTRSFYQTISPTKFISTYSLKLTDFMWLFDVSLNFLVVTISASLDFIVSLLYFSILPR